MPVDPPAVVLPSPMYLAPPPPGDFIEERRQLLEQISRATASGAGAEDARVAKAVLDFADFHFAEGMAVEGLSILEGLDRERLAPAFAARQAALQLAMGLIDPRDRPLPEAAAVLLTPDYSGWADQPLFLALARIREGSPGEAAPYLHTALQRLARFPAPVKEAMLPPLLDAAISAEQWGVARDLAAQFGDYPALRDGPAYAFLVGRAAETGGNLLAAFESYVQASDGADLWAHKARVALVDMGLASETLEPGEARQLLETERQLWFGDAAARAVFRRVAELQAEAGDRIEALDSLGALINRYPESEEAADARGLARALIASVYEDGATGTLTLSEFLTAHRRIALDFRFDPEFAVASERFADRFRAAAATKIAADEYDTIHNYLAVIRDLGIAEVEDTRLDGLRLAEAETLIEGGRYEAARDVLAAGLLSQDEALRDRWNGLLADSYSQIGADDEVVRTEVFVPSEAYLRTKAAAYFDLGDWAGAEQAYSQLFAQYGPGRDTADKLNLILATFRNGDPHKAVELAKSFPDLTTRPELAEIAESLADLAPDLLPLRKTTAEERIGQAGTTLERMDAEPMRSN